MHVGMGLQYTYYVRLFFLAINGLCADSGLPTSCAAASEFGAQILDLGRAHVDAQHGESKVEPKTLQRSDGQNGKGGCQCCCCCCCVLLGSEFMERGVEIYIMYMILFLQSRERPQVADKEWEPKTEGNRLR